MQHTKTIGQWDGSGPVKCRHESFFKGNVLVGEGWSVKSGPMATAGKFTKDSVAEGTAGRCYGCRENKPAFMPADSTLKVKSTQMLKDVDHYI